MNNDYAGMNERKQDGFLDSTSHDVAVLGLTVLLVSCSLNIFERLIVDWKVPDIREKEMDLQHTIESLRREAVKLTAPDTFAAAAKADRKAIALEKELERMRQYQRIQKSHYLVKLPGVFRMVLFLGLVFIAVFDRSVSSKKVVTYMDPVMVWPLGRWLSVLSGHGRDVGVIGVVPFAILSHRVSRYIVRNR